MIIQQRKSNLIYIFSPFLLASMLLVVIMLIAIIGNGLSSGWNSTVLELAVPPIILFIGGDVFFRKGLKMKNRLTLWIIESVLIFLISVGLSAFIN